MILTGFLPLALLTYGPHWMRPVLAVLAVILLVVAVFRVRRRILLDREDMENWPSRSEYRWPEGWDVRRYHRVLLTWLKVEDWRVLAAQALDPDRLLLSIQRDRHRLPVLLLRPGIPPDATEIERLRAIQQQEAAFDAALISSAPTRLDPMPGEDGTQMRLLNYEALPYLAEDLEQPAAG